MRFGYIHSAFLMRGSHMNSVKSTGEGKGAISNGCIMVVRKELK